MKKICIIGGPSSGKTVTALLLGVWLKMAGKEVHFVLEYATNYIIRNGEPKNIFEQLAIFCGQRDEEGYIEKRQTGDFLVTDGASFSACPYARLDHYRPSVGASKEEIQKYNYVLKTLDKWAREQVLASYDYIFFLPKEFKFKGNDVRWQKTDEEAQEIGEKIESYLRVEGRKYYRITGSPEERVEKILKILAEAEEKEKNPKIFPVIE